jgi:putative flavoprotein involved in K+ transport
VGSAGPAGGLVRGLARAGREDADGADGRRRFHGRGIPLARGNYERLDRATWIQRVPRTTGVRGGLPVLDDGRVLEVANVVWCTGFVPDFGWIDLPVFDQDGGPVHDRGIVGSEPGLYFVGLLFLYSLSSPLVGGVGRDAEHIARQIATRPLLDLPKARVPA